MDRWTDWAGTTSRNAFFYNTLDNLKQITGQPPQIRIGANSEDHTNFKKHVQFAQAIFPPSTPVVPYPEATNITVGDSYYATTRFLPPKTHVIWGVNLGSNNITAAVLETRSIVKAFSSPDIRAAGIVLDYLEIGNEPDLNPYFFFFKGAPGVSNTAGAALWTLDYALFASQLKISTVFFHAGIGFKYSLIQPITLTRSTLDGSNLPSPVPAHVQPQYYAAIIAAEAIGKTGNVQALELQIDHPQIAGYAFYEGKALVRAVFINSKAYLPESTTRTSVHLDLRFTANAARHVAPTWVKVKRLVIQ
ncbi:hypothetical protein DXG03_004144 [Asterophora parasitica]|uniref:Beta-glucuronidase C-terminal domain-containing protein n=1 Tax=Asterophora parasitica TaxID=117018 RepID=A0A9P7G2X8_9AGAR|nr:hypothetical protein DXG03_004144 [Asterophora parasitica]